MSELHSQDSRSFGRNLTYGLVEALGRGIVTGAYDRAPFPNEGEIAVQHGVSRSVSREAVKMLTAKGLLASRPRQGTSVLPSREWNLFDTDILRWLLERKFSLELLREFTELRFGIEPTAAKLAAAAGTKSQKAEIEQGYQRMVAAEAGEEDGLNADIAFHVAILEASNNAFYRQFRDVVGTALRTSIRFTNRFRGHTASLPDHLAVLEAIMSGDADEAERQMAHIIRKVMALIEEAKLTAQSS